MNSKFYFKNNKELYCVKISYKKIKVFILVLDKIYFIVEIIVMVKDFYVIKIKGLIY